MIKNMGSADRIIRLLIVVLIIALYLADVISGTLAVILGIAAGIFFITSLIGFCPAYYPLGIKTIKKKEA